VKAAAAIAGLMLAPLLGGCGFDVMYADWKVDRLCKVDGGVRVETTDVLPAELKQADGSLDLLKLIRADDGQPYSLRTASRRIQAGSPEIMRMEYQLIRRADSKVLGTAVRYVRPTENQGVPFLHSNAHACPPHDVLRTLVEAIFTK